MGLLQATFVMTDPELRPYIFLTKRIWIIRDQSSINKGSGTSSFCASLHVKQTEIWGMFMDFHEFYDTLCRISKALLTLHNAF